MKKHFKLYICFILVIILSACFGSTICVFAADSSITGENLEEIKEQYSIVLSDTSFVYNGSIQYPTVKVVNDESGATLNKSNYTVQYKDSKDVGKYKVKVVFAGKYEDYESLSASYKITALTLKENSKISLSNKTLSYNGKERTNSVTVKVNGKKLTKNVDYTVTYSNNKNVGKAKVTVTGINNYKGTVSQNFIITPGKVEKLKCKTRTKSSITLQWSKTKGASGYKVYIYDKNEKKYIRKKTLTSASTTSYEISSLNSATEYKFVVKAYVNIGNTKYEGPKANPLKTYTSIPKYSGKISLGRSNNSTKMTVKYTAAKRGTGYQVAYSYDSSFKKDVQKTFVKDRKTLKTTLNSLSKNKSYYVKVRIYLQTSDGEKHYGKWSSAVCDYSYKKNSSVDINKAVNSKKMTVKYTKSPYGSGYEIAYSKDSNFKNNVKKVYVKGLSNTSATITGLSQVEGYYVKVRPYQNVDSRRVYGAYSKVVSNIYAEYTTAYVNNSNRTNNLKIASSAINGTVIEPGKTFNFNSVVGPRTAAKGYKSAPLISGSGIGGGICQVASTVYNTALISNFKIVERHQHSARVSYVPLGRDAAIYQDKENLRWTNSSKYKIQIKMTVQGGYMTCTFLSEKNVKPPSVSLKVSQSGKSFTLKRYVNGKCNYTAHSKY